MRKSCAKRARMRPQATLRTVRRSPEPPRHERRVFFVPRNVPAPPLSVAAASRALSSRRSGGGARHGASGFSALRFSGSSAVRRRRRDAPAPFRRNPVRRIGTAANGPHRTCEAADAVNTTISVRVKKRGSTSAARPRCGRISAAGAARTAPERREPEHDKGTYPASLRRRTFPPSRPAPNSPGPRRSRKT